MGKDQRVCLKGYVVGERFDTDVLLVEFIHVGFNLFVCLCHFCFLSLWFPVCFLFFPNNFPLFVGCVCVQKDKVV